MKSWNVSDETKGKITFEPIKTRKCNEDDFNDLEGSNSQSRFYKSESQYTFDATKDYVEQMLCLDEDQINMYGHYNAG